MAKGSGGQGRRPWPSVRRRARRGASGVTLGELIAAAFDVLGDADEVARVLSSKEMAKAIGRKITVS
ncbi:MAG: hypothetical protein ACYC8T_34150 [Myxococcaceae bacterium]